MVSTCRRGEGFAQGPARRTLHDTSFMSSQHALNDNSNKQGTQLRHRYLPSMLEVSLATQRFTLHMMATLLLWKRLQEGQR
jgi:hypothetical protein